MYYIGTKLDCEDYDKTVTEGENYVNGDNWANPTKHHTNNEYCIIAHPNYVSEMESHEELPTSWLTEEDKKRLGLV